MEKAHTHKYLSLPSTYIETGRTALFVLLAFFLCSTALADNKQKAHKYLEQYQTTYESDPDNAIQYIEKAYNIYKEIGDSLMVLRTAYEMGKYYMLIGDMNQSIDRYYKALNYCSDDDMEYKLTIYIRIGSIYSSFGDFVHAIEMINKGISMAKAINDSMGIADGYNALGLVYTYKNESAIADKYFNDALQINRALGSKRNVAANINNMCLYKGNTNEKIKLLDEAIAINDSLGENWALSENYNNLGMQYFYAERYNEALGALSKAREYAEIVNSKELICDNYEYFSKVYYVLGKYREAYDNYQLFYKEQKEIMKRNEILQTERRIAKEKLDNERRKVEEHRREYRNSLVLYIVSAVFTIIIITLIFLGKNIKKKKELQLANAQKEVDDLKLQQQALEIEVQSRKLDSAQKELTNFVLFINSRNELLDNIREMIKSSSRKDANDAQTCLKKINSYILQVKNMEDSNENIVRNIDEQNTEFLRRLMEKHPNLTQGERKLATFLRVNLSTKEISLLSGITVKAVSMARYRLRKALNLSPQDDITQYLRDI